jgi:hypothetical protein
MSDSEDIPIELIAPIELITSSQDNLLLRNLMQFYESPENMENLVDIVGGKSQISLRIVDWFVTNYAKKYYTNYVIPMKTGIVRDTVEPTKFKVYDKYKLQLKAYSKRRFDPFCRWDRISIPYKDETFLETTLGQLNFFKWAIEHKVLEYIGANYAEIELDMNSRNNGSKRSRKSGNTASSVDSGETDNDGSSSKNSTASSTASIGTTDGKTRKKRQELSVSACKCIMKEEFKIVVRFND